MIFVLGPVVQTARGQAESTPRTSPSPNGSNSASPSETSPPVEAATPTPPELMPVEPTIFPGSGATPPEEQNPNVETELPEGEPDWRGELGEPEQASPTGDINGVAPQPKVPGPRLALGPFRIQPLVQAIGLYDDNVLISHVDRKSDFMWIIAPGLSIGAGDYLEKSLTYFRIDYTPVFVLFADHTEFNSIDQYLRVEGRYATVRLTVSPYFEYDKLSGPDRDLGTRVDRERFIGGVNMTYIVSDKTSIDVNGVAWSRQNKVGIDSKEVFNNDWLNFQVTPKLDVDVGIGLGVLKPEGSARQTYEQGLVRVRLAPTVKLTFNANVGVELRQVASDAGDRATPVFGLGAVYKPFEETTIRLTGARRVYSSKTAAGVNFTSTTVDLDIKQHLWRQFFAGLTAGYENHDYSATDANVKSLRQDNLVYVRPELVYRFRDWLEFTIFYQHQENDSTRASLRFSDNQVGLEALLSF